MYEENNLESGYWLRSVVDLVGDFIKTYTFWAAVVCGVTFVTVVGRVGSSEPTDQMATVLSFSFLGAIGFFSFASFSIYRRKNAMIHNLLADAIAPLAVLVDPLEGSTYQFELLTGDSYEKLVERAEDMVVLRRKLRLTQEKDVGRSAEELEAQQDLIELYEKKLDRGMAELQRLSDTYHVPDVRLDLRVRLKNPDEYRVANVQNVVVGFGAKPAFWVLEQQGLFDANGNQLQFPLSLEPGAAILGTYRCKLRKAGKITPDKMARYLEERKDTSVPVQVAVLSDDTFGGVSKSTLEHHISLGPLKDTFTEHWRASKFYNT
ncbi:hypothetical protein FIV42_15705 [Persicimonas caeni]|uniref:Uncharacterized protein n=1 Tax=Persicimonas caeni TaxID=2292766 RepID=A0A4Y6PWL2_PERCE|nr:hypothetical protein [Persicimonas caeni]QDG52135.1 hypothetical protein FIV42_15705 [Persicimonas caeni]QED33357.1 hypothetical protein FRD00_15700 [Persicimonas caeni]